MKILKLICLMAYLNLTALVTLGNVQLQNISECEITESINEFSDKAKITIARNYQQLANTPVLDNFKVGDAATIALGYNGTNNIEFNGYINEIGADAPVVIECDEMYHLRQNNFIKSYKSATLLQVLTDVLPGYTIKCPTVNLGKFNIDNASTYKVLTQIKQDYGLYSKFYDKTLIVDFIYAFNSNNAVHTYTTEYVKTNNLKYKRAADYNVKVKVKLTMPNGKDETVETGSTKDNAAVTTINFPAKTTAEAKKIADANYKKIAYDGYTGTITGFGVPLVHSGDTLIIKSLQYPEREGSYLVEKVVTKFEEGGWERIVHLAFKVA